MTVKPNPAAGDGGTRQGHSVQQNNVLPNSTAPRPQRKTSAEWIPSARSLFRPSLVGIYSAARGRRLRGARPRPQIARHVPIARRSG